MFVLPLAAVAAYAVLEGWKSRGGVWRRPLQDWLLEVLCLVLLPGLVVPAISFAAAALLGRWAPSAAGALSGWPWPAMALAFLVVDDLSQYLWHRLSHSTPLLWRLHRAHHAAPKMGVNVTFRNNLFYYIFMPGLWLSPVLVYLGMGAVYPWYVALKILVIAGAHSELRYDRLLWRSRWTRPLAWVIERLFSTPATHFAHHGLHEGDPGTHYRGNYGNMLFIWDMLFGTARITRRYPESFGIENEPARPWTTQLFWPLVPDRAEQAGAEPAVRGLEGRRSLSMDGVD